MTGEESLKKLLSVLCKPGYKGAHGRVGVIGGCRLYTGAPYLGFIVF